MQQNSSNPTASQQAPDSSQLVPIGWHQVNGHTQEDLDTIRPAKEQPWRRLAGDFVLGVAFMMFLPRIFDPEQQHTGKTTKVHP